MKKQPVFFWDEETGSTQCIIEYKGIVFIGKARCHPLDTDMKNRLMGQTISESRAIIKILKHIKSNELKQKLQALNHLYHNMKFSKYFNPNSYEAKMLFRQINMVTQDIENIEKEIYIIQKGIEEYINKKNKEHQIIRDFRKKKQMAKDNQ